MNRFVRMISALTLAVGLTVAALASNASLYVVHGINGGDLGLDEALPVDVYVNDSLAIPGFTFKAVVGPLSLPAGSYDIAIKLANTDITVIEATVPFASGENATVIAHLTEGGAPTASKFTNNVSLPGFFRSRVIVHHTAAAPAVDVYLKRLPFFSPLVVQDFANGEQASALIGSGIYRLWLTPAGTTTPVLGPATALFIPRTTYLVYAVGTINDTRNSLDLIVIPVKFGR
ncbi:MAG: DUF4397 domain-containing protein [Fimbriimonadia bacterium]|jgi:hypothetical protein